MYCSQCGKKVMENMLFCPFCGSPIIIPDQVEEKVPEAVVNKPVNAGEMIDEKAVKASEAVKASVKPAEAKQPKAAEVKKAAEVERPRSIFERPAAEDVSDGEAEAAKTEVLQEKEEHVSFSQPPVQISETEDDREESVSAFRGEAPEAEKRPPEMKRREERPVRLEGHAPRLEGKNEKRRPDAKPDAKARGARTYVPPRPLDEGEIFMDEEDPFDTFDTQADDFELESRDYAEYEDDEGSFIMRHLRGIMALSLFAVLGLIFAIYVFSDMGQIALAKMNLAWKPEVYSKVAYDYYQTGMYDMAGSFYEKALARDADEYSYASSAAMAYISNENTDKAASMLKRCISIDPNRVEPYVYLMGLYPDTAKRPWDVTQLLQQGYRATGDERLKAVQ